MKTITYIKKLKNRKARELIIGLAGLMERPNMCQRYFFDIYLNGFKNDKSEGGK